MGTRVPRKTGLAVLSLAQCGSMPADDRSPLGSHDWQAPRPDSESILSRCDIGWMPSSETSASGSNTDAEHVRVPVVATQPLAVALH